MTLPVMYGTRLRPLCDTTAITCKCTLKPANPTIQEESRSLEKSEISSPESSLIPLTNSNPPRITECIIPVAGTNSRKSFDMTLTKITAPHTVRILFTELDREMRKISPTLFCTVAIGACGGVYESLL